jgi:3-phosphoglycerate kinase
MALNKQTIEDIDVVGKTVLMRTDYNVPMDANGNITDQHRIEVTLPSLYYLLSHGARKVVLVSHLGRPGGKIDPKLSLKPVAAALNALIPPTTNVEFAEFLPGVLGDGSEFLTKMTANPDEKVILLENLRFGTGEDEDSEEFARALVQSTGADLFVQEGFAVLHRKTATTDAITRLLPSVAGLLVASEVESLQRALYDPTKPFLSISGGAKVSEKVTVLEKLLELSDPMLIGGAMANIFLQHSGNSVGASLVEKGQNAALHNIYKTRAEHNSTIIIPTDAVVVKDVAKPEGREIKSVKNIAPDDIIVDIGPETVKSFFKAIDTAKTIFWNGTLGMSETPEYAEGTRLIAEFIGRKKDCFSIIGGGDTAGYVRNLRAKEPELKYSLISTGGGATLDFIAGETLPGLADLLDK